MGNLVFSALLLVFGVAYYRGSANIPRNMLEDPVGASGYPRLLAACIILLSLVLLLQSAIGLRSVRAANAATVAVSLDIGARLKTLGPPALLFLTIAVFLAVFEHLGYLISVTLFLIAVILQRGTRLGWMPISTAIGGAVCFHLLFGELLGVRLPDGVLPMPF